MGINILKNPFMWINGWTDTLSFSIFKTGWILKHSSVLQDLHMCFVSAGEVLGSLSLWLIGFSDGAGVSRAGSRTLCILPRIDSWTSSISLLCFLFCFPPFFFSRNSMCCTQTELQYLQLMVGDCNLHLNSQWSVTYKQVKEWFGSIEADLTTILMSLFVCHCSSWSLPCFC